MKKLIALIMLVAMSRAGAWDISIKTMPTEATTTRTVEYSYHFFVVSYEYNPSRYSIPLTNPLGDPHYDAKITVFEVVDGKKIQVSEPFKGTYVAEGCFCDEPERWVKQALEIQADVATTKTEELLFYDTCQQAIDAARGFYERQKKERERVWEDVGAETNLIGSLLVGDPADAPVATMVIEYTPSDEAIKRLAAEGRICDVIGHAWVEKSEYYRPVRKCYICDKRQYQIVPEPCWIDE